MFLHVSSPLTLLDRSHPEPGKGHKKRRAGASAPSDPNLMSILDCGQRAGRQDGTTSHVSSLSTRETLSGLHDGA